MSEPMDLESIRARDAGEYHTSSRRERHALLQVIAKRDKRIAELEAARDHLLDVIGYLHDKVGELASRDGAP